MKGEPDHSFPRISGILFICSSQEKVDVPSAPSQGHPKPWEAIVHPWITPSQLSLQGTPPT